MQPDLPTMYCMHCDYPLDGLPYDRCPECGRFFDVTDAATYKRNIPNAVTLYNPGTSTQAHILRLMLEAAGIKAMVVGEALDSVLGHLPNLGTEALVQVPSDDLPAARAVLERMFEQEREPPGDPWQCDTCLEAIDGQFSACWNCGRTRPD